MNKNMWLMWLLVTVFSEEFYWTPQVHEPSNEIIKAELGESPPHVIIRNVVLCYICLCMCVSHTHTHTSIYHISVYIYIYTVYICIYIRYMYILQWPHQEKQKHVVKNNVQAVLLLP